MFAATTPLSGPAKLLSAVHRAAAQATRANALHVE